MVQRNIGLYLVAEVIAVAGIVLITLFAIQNEFAKQTFVGVICDVFNIAMYGAPSLVIVSYSLFLADLALMGWGFLSNDIYVDGYNTEKSDKDKECRVHAVSLVFRQFR